MTSKTPPTSASPPSTPQKVLTTPLPAETTLPTSPDGIVLAAVIGAHGIGGEVRLKLFGESLGKHRSFNDGALKLTSLRAGGNGSIARFAGVSDRNAADALRGTLLSVPRKTLAPLEDGEYYHADLIGLAAVSTDGSALGQVVAVENFGAGDVIEVERPPLNGNTGKRFMVPISAVPEWDRESLTIEAEFVVD